MNITDFVARCQLCPQSNFTTLCLGESCLMGWRWTETSSVEIKLTKKGEPSPGDEWVFRQEFPGNGGKSWGRPWTADRTGYCGYAGKP